MTTQHAKFSPSSMPKLAECRGFRSSDQRTADGDRGWRVDDALTAIINGSNNHKLDAEDEQACVEYGLGIFTNLLKSATGCMVQTQRRIECIPDLHVFGTADLVMVDEWSSRGIILDWKTGWGKRPPATAHLQLLCYAIGIAREFGIDQVEVWVAELDRKSETHGTLDKAALADAEKTIRQLIAEAEAVTDEQLRINDGCKYCGRRETCPAISKEIAAVAEQAPIDESSCKAVIAQWTNQELGTWLSKWREKVNLAASLLGHAEERAIKVLMAGGSVDGWGVAPGRTTRNWEDPVAAQRVLHEAAPAADIIELPALKSVANVEKELKKQGLAASAVRDILGRLIVEKKGQKLVKMEAAQ